MTSTQPLADYPVSFGYKCSWLALRPTISEAVVRALNLIQIQPCGWRAGISSAYQGDVFVTPLVQGWVLAVSFNFPWPPDTEAADRCTPWLLQLGQQFAEVQFFATHRVVETHAWARLVDGVLLRQYAYSGEAAMVLWDHGLETAEEAHLRHKQQLELESLDEEEDDQEAYTAPEDPNAILMVSESDVMYIACQWSIDPTALDALKGEPSFGYRGRLPV